MSMKGIYNLILENCPITIPLRYIYLQVAIMVFIIHIQSMID